MRKNTDAAKRDAANAKRKAKAIAKAKDVAEAKERAAEKALSEVTIVHAGVVVALVAAVHHVSLAYLQKLQSAIAEESDNQNVKNHAKHDAEWRVIRSFYKIRNDNDAAWGRWNERYGQRDDDGEIIHDDGQIVMDWDKLEMDVAVNPTVAQFGQLIGASTAGVADASTTTSRDMLALAADRIPALKPAVYTPKGGFRKGEEYYPGHRVSGGSGTNRQERVEKHSRLYK